jgi:hypothetical protein
MMGTLILIAYLVGFFLTWIIAYGMVYRAWHVEELIFEGPVEAILMCGMFGLLIASMWPIVIVIFGIHRIATRNIKVGDDDNP